MAIKNIIIYGYDVEKNLNKLKYFLNDSSIKIVYEKEKITILSQYTRSAIRDNLIKTFYHLWLNYINYSVD